jgi:hypothetical protein
MYRTCPVKQSTVLLYKNKSYTLIYYSCHEIDYRWKYITQVLAFIINYVKEKHLRLQNVLDT